MRNHLPHTKLLALADDVVYPGPLFSEQEEIYTTNVLLAAITLVHLSMYTKSLTVKPGDANSLQVFV